jgi:ribose/xylose/arabinose/galactoside ABC-type transport system permease subunit
MTMLEYARPDTARRFDWLALLAKLGPLIGLVFVFALFAIMAWDRFATPGNIVLMLRHTTVVGIAALGMTLIIISGGIDLSVGSAIALTTVTTALMMKHGMSPTLSAALAIGVTALCGLLTGVLVTWGKLAPFVVTLGLWGALRGLALGLANNTQVQVPDPNTWVGRLLTPDSFLLLPPSIWLMLILTVLVAAMLRYTRFGRHIFAVGSNEQTARLCGIPIERTKLLIYVLGAVFTGLAGLLQFSYVSSQGDPNTAIGKELDIIAAVVIGGASLSGGQGSILGTIIGALIMTMLANGCNAIDLSNWVQQVVTGVMIVIAVALDRIRHRRI